MIHIIPKPLLVERKEGNFLLDAETKLVFDRTHPEMIRLAAYFNQVISAASDFQLSTDGEGEGSGEIHLKLSDTAAGPGREGYHLSVKPEITLITAETVAGLFYGLQTLRQLLPVEFEDADAPLAAWRIPCVEIEDRPRFSWRGQMLDVSRHFLPPDLVRKNLDHLARYKMNVFHWHLTDDQGWRLQIKKYPNLTETGAWRVDRNTEPWWGREPAQPGEKATYGGFYSQEEIREIVKYAGERYITIVPEIDMPGHSQATIASYPEISCDGGPYSVATGGVASGNTVCPGKEITFEFIDHVLEEVFELFPGPYFHIGGDECNKDAWRNCADCQKRMADEGLKNEDELQSYFIHRVENLVNARGRILIGWDEIREGGLAPNAAVMSWRGEDGGIAAARQGHDVVMTPAAYCYLDLKQGDPQLEPDLGYSQCWLSTTYSYDPVPAVLSPAESKHILGAQGNLWGESIQNETHFNYMLFPRLLAVAEVTWTPAGKRQWDDFVARLETNMKRLDILGVGYARSMYNVSVDVNPLQGKREFEIHMKSEHGKVPIHFTLDGAAPSNRSPEFNQPLRLHETTVIKAAAFRDGRLLNNITTRELKVHLGASLPVTLESPWHDRYPPVNDGVLTDCLRGSLAYGDGKWMGFEGDDMIAILDFGKPLTITRVTVGTMENQDHYVFLPREVEVQSSLDNKVYRDIGRITVDSATRHDTDALREIHVTFAPVMVKYLKVKASNLAICPGWHPGAGQKSWLFVDEIIVE